MCIVEQTVDIQVIFQRGEDYTNDVKDNYRRGMITLTTYYSIGDNIPIIKDYNLQHKSFRDRMLNKMF